MPFMPFLQEEMACKYCGDIFQFRRKDLSRGRYYCSVRCAARDRAPRPRRSLIDRFWDHVVKTDGCWLWEPTVATNDYGRIRIGGRGAKVKTHRLSWEIHVGPIPDGMHVLHRCDTPPCVRPEHLFLGTHAENHVDKTRKGRQTRGEGVVIGKLTADSVRAIRTHLADGMTQRAIAAMFTVSHTAIRWIAIGKTWKHVS